MAKKNPVTYKEFDINVGLSYAGSEEQYVKFLKRYFSMTQGKTKRIKQCCEREDIEEYTMEVHALKSNSRLIGAISLADEAEYLEQCGMSGNIEEIKKKTPQMLKSLKAVKELFSFIISKEEQEKGDLKISPEETKKIYKEIIEALEEFDIDTADYLLDSMMNYELTEAQTEYIFRAKKKVVDFAYDKAMEVMKIAISTL
ncbi:MAG: Hpt domain-containing protein [Lachnospiraceae bacterium]|nr:Hpt domain-containing protein [Lachnospiraceae bacterium]